MTYVSYMSYVSYLSDMSYHVMSCHVGRVIYYMTVNSIVDHDCTRRVVSYIIMTVVSTVDDDRTCRQMINVISAGSPVIESSYVELEDGKAKMQSCLYFKNHLRFSMCGTHMRSMNESVVTTMLVVQPMSRVRNPMAVLSMMIGDIWYKVRKRCASADSLQRTALTPANTVACVTVP